MGVSSDCCSCKNLKKTVYFDQSEETNNQQSENIDNIENNNPQVESNNNNSNNNTNSNNNNSSLKIKKSTIGQPNPYSESCLKLSSQNQQPEYDEYDALFNQLS